MKFRDRFEKTQRQVVKTRKNVQRWLETFHSICPNPDADVDPHLIFNHARPTFFREKLTAISGPKLSELGTSRLEHLPDLPHGMDWPQHEGKALDFVAQINLADLEADFHPALPKTGWLYFFCGGYLGRENYPSSRSVFRWSCHGTSTNRTSIPSPAACADQCPNCPANFSLRLFH